jgi:hypothetical protein
LGRAPDVETRVMKTRVIQGDPTTRKVAPALEPGPESCQGAESQLKP